MEWKLRHDQDKEIQDETARLVAETAKMAAQYAELDSETEAATKLRMQKQAEWTASRVAAGVPAPSTPQHLLEAWAVAVSSETD